MPQSPSGRKENHMEPFIGEIKTVGFNFAPVGWALCNGQTLAISQYTALFSLLGTTYGGDGRTNFQLPDLQGRVPLNVGNGAGLPQYAWGQKGGNATATLATANLPAHTHLVNVSTNNADQTSPSGAILAVTNNGAGRTASLYPTYTKTAANATLANTAIQPAGSGTPFNIEPPYLALYFIIALVGVFPSRN